MIKSFYLFLFTVLIAFYDSNAQESARICFSDSTILEIKEFTTLRTELFYYRSNYASKMKENSPVDFIREYKPGKLQHITFKYEKGKGTEQFYYQLLIEGITNRGTTYRKKVKAWDWLEMSPQGPVNGRNTEIIFFTEKKKPEIVKIEFF